MLVVAMKVDVGELAIVLRVRGALKGSVVWMLEEVGGVVEEALEGDAGVDVAEVGDGEELAPEDVAAAELDVSVEEAELLGLESAPSTSVHASGTSSLFCWPSD